MITPKQKLAGLEDHKRKRSPHLFNPMLHLSQDCFQKGRLCHNPRVKGSIPSPALYVLKYPWARHFSLKLSINIQIFSEPWSFPFCANRLPKMKGNNMTLVRSLFPSQPSLSLCSRVHWENIGITQSLDVEDFPPDENLILSAVLAQNGVK